ncbi:hypothetical protein ACLOJK_041512 [Asimina triloba]
MAAGLKRMMEHRIRCSGEGGWISTHANMRLPTRREVADVEEEAPGFYAFAEAIAAMDGEHCWSARMKRRPWPNLRKMMWVVGVYGFAAVR